MFLECSEHRDLSPVGNYGALELRLYVPHFSYACPTNEIEGLAE